ncbi:MAG: hypothetical protein COA45_01320 [Zetaproteobacteria bacterium]|nr:MAG: hypothetical protein COA45_01320 [Zetaproteobacteria bacterium]
MYRNFYRFIFVLSSFFVVGCSTDYVAYDDKNSAVEERLANIEDEPITRLSFFPVENMNDKLDVILHQDGEVVGRILPASGDGNATEKISE